MKTFSERLRYYRVRAAYSQKGLAQKLGMTRQNYGRYENKDLNVQPTLELLKMMAAALGVDVNTLIGYEKEKTAGQVGKDKYKELRQVINDIIDWLFDCLELLPYDKEPAAKIMAEAIKLTENGKGMPKYIYKAFLEAENKRLLNSAVNAGGSVPETVGHTSEQGQGLPDLMAGK